MPNANLSFLPWVRQGAASAISIPDSQTASDSGVATVTPTLTLNSQPVTGVAVTLRGPSDVIGIDANQVVRTDPQPGTHDFEPNCFPSIEFDRPDFPWLFTPAKANGAERLRPWLCLVVVRKQAGVSIASTPTSPLASLTITGATLTATELPDLKDSWAWAHSQVASANNSQRAIDAAFAGGPELTLSRLVCPRMLVANTDYIACVVPTFDAGRTAGLGQPITAKDLTPAWIISPAPKQVVLPVYYQWEFRTGEKGDFASLADKLTPGAPLGIGMRPIDISAPGFPAGRATTAQLEGALLPVVPPTPPRAPPPPAQPDPIPPPFKMTLASIINEPSRLVASKRDPLLAPPLYGRWHAANAAAVPAGTTWLDQLNLDPRWRVAAAFGTRVVQEHQEALMASAWEQAADLPSANQRMRQLQLSMAVGQVLHARHFKVLTEEMMLRVAAPAFGRLQSTTGSSLSAAPAPSLLAMQIGTKLPPSANRSAMRRIGRQRGPLSRRVALKGAPRTSDTWVARLNDMWTGSGAPPASPPPVPQPPQPAPMDFAQMPALSLYTNRLFDTASSYGAFFVSPPNVPVIEPGVPLLTPNHVETPDFFRTAARAHVNGFFPSRPAVQPPQVPVYPSVKQQVLDQTHPRVSLPPLVGAIIAIGDGVLAPTAPGVAPMGVETVMATPYFPQPMYETLRDLSQEPLLPGLDKVSPDTVCGLETNRRFVEAFMVGLNHEMGRELLWRGYPTDQRGTYFDRFWGLGVPNTAPADITDLETWSIPDANNKIRMLGDSVGAPALAEEFVMLMRSSLLRRYPNAVIYLTPGILARGKAATDPYGIIPDLAEAHEVLPLFSGSMQPDVSFFGFSVSPTAAIGGPGVGLGYYLIIQEHPTETRFGIDANVPISTTHLVIGATAPPTLNLQGGKWNTNAAEMARITRRPPARIAIHASRLITPT